MGFQRIRKLYSNRQQRIQLIARVGNDEGQIAAANVAQLIRSHVQQILAAVSNGPTHLSRRGKELHNGPRDEGLARSGLSDQTDHLTPVDCQVDPVERVNLALVCTECCVQVLDLQQSFWGRHR